MKELKSLQDSVKQIEGMFADHEDLGLLIEMSEEEPDEDTIAEIQEELERFKAEFEELRIQTLLTGEYDKSNAIVTLHAGAATGQECFTGCTAGGRRKKAFRWKFWIIWKGMWPGSRA